MGGHCEVAQLLLKAKADVSTGDEQELTSLHWAVGCGHTEMARSLLEFRANLDKPSKGGHVPLHFANNDSMINLLLELRADINVEDGAGEVALEMAMRGGKPLPNM